MSRMIAFRASLDREGQQQLRGVVRERCHKLVSRLEVRHLTLCFILDTLINILTTTSLHH